MSISRCGCRDFVFSSFNCFPTFVILNLMSTLIHKAGGFRAKFSPGKAPKLLWNQQSQTPDQSALSQLTCAPHSMGLGHSWGEFHVFYHIPPPLCKQAEHSVLGISSLGGGNQQLKLNITKKNNLHCSSELSWVNLHRKCCFFLNHLLCCKTPKTQRLLAGESLCSLLIPC